MVKVFGVFFLEVIGKSSLSTTTTKRLCRLCFVDVLVQAFADWLWLLPQAGRMFSWSLDFAASSFICYCLTFTKRLI